MALDRTRPFTRAQARAHKIPRRELEGAGHRRLLPGVYVAASVDVTPHLRARAALLPFPDSAHASHHTAARVMGLPVPDSNGEHVTVPRATDRRSRSGVRTHVRKGARSVLVRGVRVSEPVDLFVELAGFLSFVDLVVLGDALVRKRRLTRDRLVSGVRDAPGTSGRLARDAAAHVRPGVDSPMETRLRLLLLLAGIPEPEVNWEVRDELGDVLRRYDLCWPGVRVIVEYDGRHHIEREEQWEKDLNRRESIDDDGWRILVVVARGVYREPAATVVRIHRLLAKRGLEGLPATPLDGWREHFADRSAA